MSLPPWRQRNGGAPVNCPPNHIKCHAMAFIGKDKVRIENRQHGKPLRSMLLPELQALHECFVLRRKTVAFAAWQSVRKKHLLQVVAPLVYEEHKSAASSEHAAIVKAACATLLPATKRMTTEDKEKQASMCGVQLSQSPDPELMLATAIAKRWEPPPSLSCFVFSLSHKVWVRKLSTRSTMAREVIGASSATRALILIEAGFPVSIRVDKDIGRWIGGVIAKVIASSIRRDSRKAVVHFQFTAQFCDNVDDMMDRNEYDWPSDDVMLETDLDPDDDGDPPPTLTPAELKFSQGTKENIFRFIDRGDLPSDSAAGPYDTHKFASITALLAHVASVPVAKRTHPGWVISPTEIGKLGRQLRSREGSSPRAPRQSPGPGYEMEDIRVAMAALGIGK